MMMMMMRMMIRVQLYMFCFNRHRKLARGSISAFPVTFALFTSLTIFASSTFFATPFAFFACSAAFFAPPFASVAFPVPLTISLAGVALTLAPAALHSKHGYIIFTCSILLGSLFIYGLCGLFRFFYHLRPHERCISLIVLHQFRVVPLLEHLAFIDHDDLVAAHDGGEPMCNHNNTDTRTHLLNHVIQRALDLLLILGVQSAGGFVQE
mmetsp:Transcript_27127/g.49906  ORF Transcript_27127/g.49906 Transcript_27127/m.49906 type:complete len:209 (-) Transcript_27127:2415-3041(-)